MVKIDLKLFEDYLKIKKLRPRTIKTYMYHCVRFFSQGDSSNYTFSTYTITRFLIDKTNMNSNGRAFILHLKEFLMTFKNELSITPEELKEILEAKIPKISGRTGNKLVIPLSHKEIELIEKELETEELKLMLLICFNGGLRLQELMGIRVSSFNWTKLKENKDDMGEVKVNGKGGIEDTCILPNWLIRRIAEYIRNNKFGQESKLFQHSERHFEYKLREAGIRAGLSTKDEKGEYYHQTIVYPHRLRHSYAHYLQSRNVGLNYIKEALRHKSISSTQIYTKLSKEELKDKLRGLQ